MVIAFSAGSQRDHREAEDRRKGVSGIQTLLERGGRGKSVSSLSSWCCYSIGMQAP